MRPSTIWYTLKQGIINIKRNWMFSLASILTMAACIFLVGVFYSLVTNVDNIAPVSYTHLTLPTICSV